MKAYLKKLSKLLSISLSLAIILTVLPMNTIHVHAANEITITKNLGVSGFTGTKQIIVDSEYGLTCGVGIAQDSSRRYKATDLNFALKNSTYKLVSVVATSNTSTHTLKVTSDRTAELSTNLWTFTRNSTPSDITLTITLQPLHTHSYGALSSDATYHWYQCTSGSNCTDLNGSKKDTAAHTLKWEYNGTQHRQVCSVCGYVKVNWTNHSGGTATCTAKAKCTTCGQSYGNTKAHSYTVLKYDTTSHWYKCANCTATNTKVAHSGGAATCTTPAVCSTCGQSYGTVGGHTYSTAWSFDGSTHWHQCINAGCEEKSGEAAHSGGTATCLQKATCSTCNELYGELAAHNLVKQNAKDATCVEDGWQEYWECSVCHEVYTNAQGTGTKYTTDEWKHGAGKLEKNNDHIWSYTVNVNTITATCTREGADNHTASISISANNAEYTGLAYTGTDESAWTNSSLGLTVPTVNYVGREGTTYESTTAPTNAGKYTAQITVGEGESAVTASYNFEITKKEVELNWHNTVVTYNGASQSPTATVTNKANATDEVNVNVTFDSGHTNAGTYTATASSLSGTAANNYTLPATLPTHQFVIEPKAIGTTTITPSFTKANPLTYNNSSFTQSVSITDGGNPLTLNTDFELDGDITKIEPGLYETIVKGKGNYTGETTIEWEIEAAEINTADIHVTPYHGEYDGGDHSIKVEPKGDFTDATVTYSETKNGEYSATNPTYKNAGEYTVYYKVEKTGHTTLKDFSTVTITHKEANIGWSDTELTYNGSAQAPTATVTNKVNGDVVNVRVEGAEVNAGTYTAVASSLYGDGSSNYVLNYKLPIEKPSTTYTINKIKVDVPSADQTKFVYNGQQKTYTIATNNLYTISNNTRTLAGTQNVIVSLKDKDNYEWNVSGTVDQRVNDREYPFTVAKASVTIPTADNTVFTYSGEEQTYGIASTDKYDVENVSHTLAGSYEVDVILKDHNNYQWSDGTTENKKFTFTINKQEVTKPTADSTVFTYTGDPQTYSLPESQVYTVSNNTHTNAGTYKVGVVLNDGDNYKWAGETGELVEYNFIINKQSVTAPSANGNTFTYDGTTKTYALVANDLYDIQNNAHIYAGTYTVNVSLKDTSNYKWSDNTTADKTYSFVINKAKVTKPAKDETTFTYNRAEQTYNLETSNLYTVLNNKATSAGNHTVTVVLKDKANYEWNVEAEDKSADQTYTFKINPLDISNLATLNLVSNSYEYTGEEITTSVSSATDGTVSIYEGTDFEVSGNKGTNVNTYTLTATFKGNYTGTKSASWTITKVAPTFVAPTGVSNLVFNDQNQTLISAGSSDDGTLVYSLSEDGTYTTTLPSAKDADSYTVWYKVIGDQNHNDTTPEYLTVTISQADASATAPTAKENLVYNKQAQALVNAGTNVVGGTMMYSLEEDGEYSATIPTGTNAGTYTVWYKVVADDNHIDTTPSSLNVTIAKANQTLTGNDVIATYGDTNKSVTIASDAQGSTLSYAIKTGEPTDVVSVNQTTGALTINKVGETKVLVSASATDNYNAATKEISVTVNKLTASLSWDDTEFSYDGTLKTPSATVTNLVGEDVVNVTVTGSQTNAGTYTATASALTGTKASNYALPLENTQSFTIEKTPIGDAQFTVTYNGSSTYPVYSGEDVTPSIVVTFNGTTLTKDVDYTLAGDTTKKNAGLYEITIEGIGNFTDETTLYWEISGKPFADEDIEITPYTGEYDGLGHSIDVNVKVEGTTITYSTTGLEDSYVATNPSFTSVGSHTVYYKIAEPNSVTKQGDTTVTIEPRTVELTWSSEQFTYDGTSKLPSATVTNKVGNEVVNVSVTGEEVNAGTYTATADSLTGTNASNYRLPTQEPTKQFTIAKASQTLNGNDVVATYGDLHKTAAVTGNVAESTVSYAIKSGEPTDVVSVDRNTGALTINKAGITKVVASASETANYNGATKEINVTVNKKVVAISWENTEFTYDGSEKIPTAEISNKVGNDDVSLTITGKKTNAGTYTASAALAGEKADNYALPTTVTKQFVINKRPIEHADFTVLYNGSEDLPEYTGQEIAPTFIVEYNGTQLVRGTDYTISGTEKATDAGMYEVTITGIGNFKDSTKLDWRILDKPFTSEDIDIYPYIGEYDGESHSISVNVKVEGTTITYSTDAGQDKTYDLTNPTFSSVGTHTVYYKITKPSHEPYMGHSTVIIEPRTIYPDWSNTELVYTGSAQKPIATINELDRVGSEVVNIEVIGEQTNVGTYTATAHSLSGANASNYRLEAQAPTTEFTIAPKGLYVTITSLGGTYGQRFDGATATCSGYVEGESTPHLTLTYYRDQECTVVTTNYDGADKDGAMPRNAGTYYVKADLTSDNNYNVVSTANNPQVKEFVVNKADLRSPLTNVVLDNVLFVKDGEVERVVNVKVTYGGVELIEGNDYELTGNSSSEVGKHTLSITGIGNFKGELTRDWAINEIISDPTNVEIEDVEEGRVTLTITGDEDAPEIVITNPENMLSEDEITTLKEGKITVDLILTIKVKEKENVNENSLAEILKFIEDTENMIVFDITMDKVIRTLDGNGHVINIETQSVRETEGHVTVTIDVPSTIPSVQSGYKRVYTVIRSHENMDGTFTAEKLDTSYVSNKVTFESNKFSDYVLTYKDTRIPRPSTPNRYKAPNTGVGYENNSINKTIGLLSILVLAGCIVKKRKED